jgi:protoporphyrinogen IX oxidase
MSALSALYELLRASHVAANLVWIGAILSVALALGSRSGDGRGNAQIAYELYRRLALPAFVVSFTTALARLLLSLDLLTGPKKYMHGKLLFAAIVIVLHHVIGARAKAVVSGRRSTPGPVGVLGLLLLIAAVAATLFVILKPF